MALYGNLSQQLGGLHPVLAVDVLELPQPRRSLAFDPQPQ